MLTCNEISKLVATGEIERLGRMKRLEFRLHMMMCKYCRLYEGQLRRLGQMARLLWGPGTGDLAVLASLEERILSQMGGRGGSPPDRPDPGRT